MDDGTSWGEVLSGEPEQQPAPEQDAPQGQPRDEHGRFASAQQQEEQGDAAALPQQEAPPASEPEPSHIPIAALKDERGKRQTLERELEQARAVLQQYEGYFAQQPAPQAPEIDPEQDPLAWLKSEVTKAVLAEVQPQTQEQQFRTHVHVSEQFARSKWPDYDQKVEVFKSMVQQAPVLWQAMQEAADPAAYAYNAANNMLSARALGDAPAPSEAEIEARLREKIMAEIGVQPPNVPTSLASQQSRGSRGGPAWSGPTAWGDVLGS